MKILLDEGYKAPSNKESQKKVSNIIGFVLLFIGISWLVISIVSIIK